MLNNNQLINAKPNATAGYTLMEVTIVVFMIGILGAIAAPAWLHFTNRQRLNTAQYEVYQAMQAAKSNAKLQKVDWQASFREQDQIVQWAVHPETVTPATAHWQSLDPNIRIDDETTLKFSDGVYKVEFNFKGHVTPPFGRLTLTTKQGGKTKRCVFVSTLLGTLRMAKENPKSNRDGKYCY
ncbi:pilus assembly FimT family protein [Coleofasciculus sp.]|uniref:pilus assembly FimT family protein n=1 Tax=Coleofasciculus sp. TaxID=3100458 RepID=UPI0039FA7859